MGSIRVQYPLAAVVNTDAIGASNGALKKVKQFGHFLHIQVTFILVFFTHELEAVHSGEQAAFLLTTGECKFSGLTVSCVRTSVPRRPK